MSRTAQGRRIPEIRYLDVPARILPWFGLEGHDQAS